MTFSQFTACRYYAISYADLAVDHVGLPDLMSCRQRPSHLCCSEMQLHLQQFHSSAVPLCYFSFPAAVND